MILLPELEPIKSEYEALSHAPLRVVLNLKPNSPLVTYEPPILDNLLGGALVQERFENPQLPETPEAYEIPLPLACLWRDDRELPLWAATYFSPVGASVADVHYQHRKLQDGDYSKNKGGKPLKLSGANGRWQERRTPLPVMVCHQWEAFAIGSPQEIARLLEGVTAVGKRRGAGMGEVESWEVLPAEIGSASDLLIRDGKLTRAIPVNSEHLLAPYKPSERPQSSVGWTPPQWKPTLFSSGWRCGAPVEIDFYEQADQLGRGHRAAMAQAAAVVDELRVSQYPVSAERLGERIERCRRTVGRIISSLQNDFGAPVEFRSRQGWVLVDKNWRLTI